MKYKNYHFRCLLSHYVYIFPLIDDIYIGYPSSFFIAKSHLYTYREINKMIYNGSYFFGAVCFQLIFVSYG